MYKLVELIEKHADELAALDALNVGQYPFIASYGMELMFYRFRIGKGFYMAKIGDVDSAVVTFRYFAGWADKIHGKTFEVRIPLLSVVGSRKLTVF